MHKGCVNLAAQLVFHRLLQLCHFSADFMAIQFICDEPAHRQPHLVNHAAIFGDSDPAAHLNHPICSSDHIFKTGTHHHNVVRVMGHTFRKSTLFKTKSLYKGFSNTAISAIPFDTGNFKHILPDIGKCNTPLCPNGKLKCFR